MSALFYSVGLAGVGMLVVYCGFALTRHSTGTRLRRAR
jgi:hypothetical protein